MVKKKFFILGAFVLLILSTLFISPTLTGNTIGPLTRRTTDIIGAFLLFLMGIMISLSLKKH